MAEFEGMQKIGSLLFGGAERMRGRAYEEGRLNTAKTEEALASAKSKQLEATARANAQRAGEKFKTNYIATESGKGRDPKEVAMEADFIGDMLISGVGSDYNSIMQGRGEQQTQGFRDTLADTEAEPEVRLQAGSAIQGKQLPRHAPVGTHGVEDLLNPGELIKGPGSGTTQQRNFEYMEGLPDSGSKDRFGRVLRADQIVDAGGGVKVARPTAGGGGGAPVVDPTVVQDNEAGRTQARRTGTEIATQKAEYPRAKFAKDRTLQDIGAMNDQAMEIARNEKLYQAFGLTRPIAEIPGTEGANLRAMVQTLTSKMMITTLLNLRSMSKTGGAVGNVSDREGLKMETAMANLSDPNISVGQVFKEVKRLIGYNADLEGFINEAFDLTYDAQGNPILAQAPRGTPAAGGGDEAGAGELTIEEIVINNGDGELDDAGNVVRSDGSGWTLETDAEGNKAWVSPDRTQYEEVAQ